MRRLLCAALLALPLPSMAGVGAVVSDHILPAHAGFAAATEELVTASAACQRPQMQAGYHAAFDAWMGVSHIQFGPIEAEGLSLAIAFWPDPKNQTEKALGRLIAAEDPAVNDPAEFAEVSVAAQGLMALESLLYGARDETPYTCALAQAIARHLAQSAARLEAAWRERHAALLMHPGPENDIYTSQTEVQRVLYTALSTGLEFLHDQRLGRPLGTYERPRPTRAEARRSARSLRNITLNLQALQAFATALAGQQDMPKSRAAFAEAIARAESLDDPALHGVADPAARLRAEVLQQGVAAVQRAVAEEIGAGLGVRAGFNALDGD
ncbi:imelysin family protein [Roseobacter sinensis]|uniref:Imelysin family protein n=1 Tax=Roseobacter sinensis TaxID=2931391 RepID=A0ABT3BI32_9RHOB|nr:imelysin family protein [Roseobacter sp. WL0113]MCV3272858.1 imelysin family protein [Roseobacter sp. WL0113]